MSAYDPGSPSRKRGKEIVTRNFKILRFDPHPRRKVLIIRGEITISVSDPLGTEIIAEETQEFKKVIRFESLTDTTNVDDIVDEVMDQCPFIAEDLVSHLLSAVEILKYRKYDHHGMAVLPSDEDGSLPNFPEYFEDDELKCEADMKEVNMESLDLYVELLYEDLADKVKGARSIWRLTTVSQNLLIIYNHDTALNAIFRTLREDCKKSMELTTNLLSIIASFAKYRDFHKFLVSNKICSLTMTIIEFELQRYSNWLEILKEKKEAVDSTSSPNSKALHDFQKLKLKFTDLIRKQDNLLAVGFEVIKYFCERKSFIRQLHKKGIVRKLMQGLERSNIKLLLVVTGFLQNVTVFKEYTAKMAEFNIVEVVVKLLNRNIPTDLLRITAALMYNLSFDTKLRHKMVKLDLLSKITSFYHSDDPEIQPISLLLLYNFSIDHIVRPKFIPINIISTLMKRLLQPREEGKGIEVVALMLNLACSKRCAQSICENNGLAQIVKVALQRQDALLMKITHKISEHEGPTKAAFSELINNIVGAVKENAVQEFVTECFGTLANLATLPHVDFSELLQGYQLLPYLKMVLEKSVPRSRQHMGDYRSPDESLLLEVVIFVGSCAGEPGCSDFLIQQNMAELLFEHANCKELDPTIRLQIFYAFYRLGSHTNSRTYIVENTEIPALVRNFIQVDNTELREVAGAAWNVFGEHNERWKDRVRTERFLAHNATWFEMVNRIKELETTAFREFREKAANYREEPKPANIKPPPPNGEMKAGRRGKKMRIKTSGSTTESIFSDESNESEGSEYAEEGDGPNSIPQGGSLQDSDSSDEEDEENPNKHLFDQLRHQYNQEMQERDKFHFEEASDDEEAFEDDDDSLGSGDRASEGTKSRLFRKNTDSRPQTAKSRPVTVASGRITKHQQIH